MRLLMGTLILLLSLSAAAASEEKGAFSPRLKYKKGPVCMCDGGLTEKDIRDALQQREKDGKTGSDTMIKPFETFRRGEKKEEE